MANTESCSTNKNITLTIDGRDVQVQEGSTILEAAQKLGIHIPTLCWLEKISTTGACRICAVEIEGVDRPMTACNTPVKEGIRVTTQSPALETIRRKTMELMLVNHPLDCPVCDAGGECELQDTCYALGADKPGYSAVLERMPIRYDWRLLESDPNRCILCEKCVKVCREVTGTAAIETQNRGDRALVETVSGKPLDCDFCGNCIAACPTGTLISKPFKFMARSWSLKVKEGICAFCSSGCQIEYHIKDGKVARVTSDDSNYNNGNLCINGRFGYAAFNSSERLLEPMILGVDGVRKPATWDAAFSTAASALKQVISNHGAKAVAGIASPRVTNEENLLFARLIKEVIGSPNLDSEASLGYAPAQAIQQKMIGCTGATAAMDKIEQAGCIIVLGSDLKAESAGFGYRVIKAATKNNAKLLIATARPTSLDKFANVTLRYKAGSEAFAGLGLIKALLASGKQLAQTEGIEQLKQSVAAISFDQINMATGLSEADFAEAVALVNEPVALLYGHEFIRSTDAASAVTAAVNLAVLTGGEVFPIDEKNNMQGMLDAGAVPAENGKNLAGIMDAIDKGEIRALVVMGTDLPHILPNRAKTEAALKKLECLIVLDIYPTSTSRYAHILLPAATAAEKGGTFTTVDNRVQSFAAATVPAGESRPDFDILAELYTLLSEQPAPAFAELQQIAANAASKSAKQKVLLPLQPKASSTASMTMLAAPIIRHNGSYSSWSENNRLVSKEAVALLSEVDAKRIGLADGSIATIAANNGSITLPVQVLEEIPAGLVVVPNHFPEAELSSLFTSPAATVSVTVTKS